MCSSIESKPMRSARLAAVDEGLAHLRHVGFIHRARLRPRRAGRDRRGTDRRPRILVGLQAEPAFPRTRRGGLAARMGELDAELRGADALAMRDDARERVLAGIRVDAGAAMRDAAAPLDAGRLDHHQRGAGIRQHAEMRRCATGSARRRRREYWHIGATTTRLASSRPLILYGENSALVMACEARLGELRKARGS